MAEFQLTPKSPLDGIVLSIGGTKIREVTGSAIVSIAIANGGEAGLKNAILEAYHVEQPAIGQSAITEVDNARFLGLQRNQLFVLFDCDAPRREQIVAAKLGEAAYLTDQSDGWVILRLSGEKSIPALQRICMLDLELAQFPPGAVARTVMEHLDVIIVREAPDTFLLISARSSAQSFLHAIETSVRNAG